MTEPPAPPPDPSEPSASSTPPPAPPGTAHDSPSSSGASGAGFGWSTLYRTDRGRLLGGVAAGLAERFGLPVLLVRAAFVVTGIIWIGVPVYALAWVLLPDEHGARVTGRGPVRDLVALGVVVAAAFVLLRQVDGIAFGSVVRRSLPWLVIVGGLALLLRRTETAMNRPQGVTPPPAAEPGGAGPLDPTTPVVRAPRPPRPRPFIGPVTWSAALLVAAAMGLIGLAGDGDGSIVGPGVIAAAVMIVVGAGLTLSAFRGRARGLLLPALALTLMLGGLAALDVRADTVGGPFDRRITSEADLPTEIRSTGATNTLDLGELQVTTNRSLTIRQTLGRVRVVLPRRTTTVVTVHVGTGNTSVERPSAAQMAYSPDLARRWLDDGLPKDGDVLSGGELRQITFDSAVGYGQYLPLDADHSTFNADRSSSHRLSIVIELGLGDVQLLDPRWSDVPDTLVTPEQLCTVGGGARGVVSPCSKVAEAQRVALCINEAGYLVDCREDRPGTNDQPRVAACRDYLDQQIDCSALGIEPVGAQLISPEAGPVTDDTIAPAGPIDPADPTGPIDPADPADPSTTIDDPSVDEATNADPNVIAPPSPEATVPPVPTTGG